MFISLGPFLLYTLTSFNAYILTFKVATLVSTEVIFHLFPYLHFNVLSAVRSPIMNHITHHHPSLPSSLTSPVAIHTFFKKKTLAYCVILSVEELKL